MQSGRSADTVALRETRHVGTKTMIDPQTPINTGVLKHSGNSLNPRNGGTSEKTKNSLETKSGFTTFVIHSGTEL
jgi:hypothetical protein